MRRFLVYVVIAAAAWFAWKEYGGLFVNRPAHEAVILNRSDRRMVGVRLKVGGQTFTTESLADGERTVFSFKTREDASFELAWSWDQSPGEMAWAGGYVPRGPLRQRHLMSVDADGSVTYLPENK